MEKSRNHSSFFLQFYLKFHFVKMSNYVVRFEVCLSMQFDSRTTQFVLEFVFQLQFDSRTTQFFWSSFVALKLTITMCSLIVELHSSSVVPLSQSNSRSQCVFDSRTTQFVCSSFVTLKLTITMCSLIVELRSSLLEFD